MMTSGTEETCPVVTNFSSIDQGSFKNLKVKHCLKSIKLSDVEK